MGISKYVQEKNSWAAVLAQSKQALAEIDTSFIDNFSHDSSYMHDFLKVRSLFCEIINIALQNINASNIGYENYLFYAEKKKQKQDNQN